jgi:hypothetical protein
MQERAELLVKTLEAVDMQEGNLDNLILNTIIINVIFALISETNQDTQNDNLAN